MKLHVTLVPVGRLGFLIPELLQYLQKSEHWTMGRANIDDILRFLLTGQMHLWAVYDPETKQIYGYNITEVKEYPQCKMLVVQYSAGEPNHMQYVENEMHHVLESFAKDAGCVGIEAFGRPGWEPHLKKHGFTVKTVVYEKFFGEQP